MKATAKVLVLALLVHAAGTAAQDRSTALDKAYQEARAAYIALQEARARRDRGAESQPGERQSSASGGSHPTANYFARQALLEQQVELARQRYQAALKRWNDLK